MTKTSRFKGVWTALWSPTNSKNVLIKKAIKQHLAFLKKSGIEGIVVGGSTGEFVRLTLKQRHNLLTTVAEEATQLDLPLIVNISDPIFDHLKELADAAKRLNVAGVLVLPPSYYPVAQVDLTAYFCHVAEVTDNLPFILYNFPECVRNNIDIDTVAALADKIHLAGIKQSGNNFEYHHDLVHMSRQKKFDLLTGADTRLPEALKIGASGTISGFANAIPELLVDVYNKASHNEDPSISQSKIEKIAKCLVPLAFPFNVMALMEARGLETGIPKIPRSPQSISLQQHLVKLLQTLPLTTATSTKSE